jgi:hypothetical protein
MARQRKAKPPAPDSSHAAQEWPLKSIDVILDECRRYDAVISAGFNTANTRASMILGFASFAVTGMPKSFHWTAQVAVGCFAMAICLSIYVLIPLPAKAGYTPEHLYNSHIYDDPITTKLAIVHGLLDAIDNREPNRTRKGHAIVAAVSFLGVAIIAALVTSLLP